MADSPPYYLGLFRALATEGVRYLVVGGVAVNLHGAERLTMDIDLMLSMDAQNLRRFLRAATSMQLRPAVLPVTLKQFCDSATVEGWIRDRHMLAFQLRGPGVEDPSVDILVKTPMPFDQAYVRRVRMSLGGVAVDVASVEDLVALKSDTGREIDKSDIRALQRLEQLRSRQRDD